MTRGTPSEGVGPDRDPATRSGKLGDAAMYAATGGAKVAKAGAYVTGGGMVAVYGSGVANVGAPESTGYESDDRGPAGAPIEKTFPDLTPNSGGGGQPAPGSGPGDSAPVAQNIALTGNLPAGGPPPVPGYGPDNGAPAGPPVVHNAPPVAEQFPIFPDAPHNMDWTGLQNIGPELNTITDQFNTMLHQGQLGDPSLFSGVGDAGNDFGVFSQIQAESEVVVDVSASANISTELEISDQGIYFAVQSSLAVSVDVQASAEVSAVTEVGNIGDQLDHLNQQGGIKSLNLSNTAGGSTPGVDGLRTGLGGAPGAGSGLGAGPLGAAPTAGFAGPQSGFGVGAPGAQMGPNSVFAPTTTAGHAGPAFDTAAPGVAAAQPVVATPAVTVIQPEAATHPIADLVHVTAPAALTAPAASLPVVFGIERHPDPVSVPSSTLTTTSGAGISGGPIAGGTGHGTLPVPSGPGTHETTPVSPLVQPKPGGLPGTGPEPGHPAPGATTLPGTATLPTHSGTGTTGTGTTGTGTDSTGTGTTGTGTGAGGHTDGGHGGGATPPLTGNTGTEPEQHLPGATVPGAGTGTTPSITSPGGDGTGPSAHLPGAGTVPQAPLQPVSPGATVPHDSAPVVVPAVPSAPLNSISPGGALTSPLHVGGVSYVLPDHPMDHLSPVSGALPLSAAGHHGLFAGLLPDGPAPESGHWTDQHQHVLPLAHH